MPWGSCMGQPSVLRPPCAWAGSWEVLSPGFSPLPARLAGGELSVAWEVPHPPLGPSWRPQGQQQGLLQSGTGAPLPHPDLLEEDEQEEGRDDEDEDTSGETEAQVLHGGEGGLRVQQQPPPQQPQHEGAGCLRATAEAAGGHHAAHCEDGGMSRACHLHSHRACRRLAGVWRGDAAFVLLLLLPTWGPWGWHRPRTTQSQLGHQCHHPAEGAADEGDGGSVAHQLAQAVQAEGMAAGQLLGGSAPPGTPVCLVADPALPAGLRPRRHGA